MEKLTYKKVNNPTTPERFVWNPIEDFSLGVDAGELDIRGVKPIIRPETELPKQESIQQETPKNEEQSPQDNKDPKDKPETKGAAPSKRYKDNKEFIEDLSASYSKALKSRGLSDSYVRMLVAQDALETGWGKSYVGNYNFGNITVPKGDNYSYTEGKDSDAKGNRISQKFRNFNSLDEYTDYKVSLLNNNRYKAFTGASDPTSFFTRVKAGGYAEDPDYVSRLLKVYNSQVFSAKQGGRIPSKFDNLIDKLGY